MKIRPIKTDKDHYNALNRLDSIFDAEAGTDLGDEAEVLTILLEEFAGKNFPIDTPDPIEAIKIRLSEMDYKQKDLVGVIGGKSRVSEILNKKKKLTVEMIRNLSKFLNISTDLLIQDYDLTP